MKAQALLPRLSRGVLYAALAAALVFPAVGTLVAQAASTIMLRSVSTGNNMTGGVHLVLPKPSATIVGDMLIAQVVVSQANTSITAPAGWHLIRTTSSNTTLKMASFYKLASSSEPASYSWTLGSSQTATGGISDYTGVDGSNPIDASSGTVNGNTSTASFTQVTTHFPYDMLVAMVGAVGNTTITPPSGFTEAYERPDRYTNMGPSVEASRLRKGPMGATSVGSAKEDTLSNTNLTQLIALRPAGYLSSPTPTPPPAPITIVAVGDMECQTANCNGVQTPQQVSQINPAMLFPVGDLVWIGYYTNFTDFYNPLWGAFRSISHPAIGNHDGKTGYYNYWNGLSATNGRAGPTNLGWYSFTKGTWHFVVLNSNCVGAIPQVSCAPGSPQINWLASDLAAHPSLCTIAFMHIPYYTSGTNQFPELQTIFQTLYKYHVELLITGHTHYYQRFYPQDGNGNRDANGVAEIVVGTGGGDLSYVQSKPSAPNQAVQIGQVFGVLKMALYTSSYSFRFLPAPGYTGSDSGSANCH